MSHTPGPCLTLARLALQSDEYLTNGDFREAVDDVLDLGNLPDDALRMLEGLEDATAALDTVIAHQGKYMLSEDRANRESLVLKNRALLREIEGKEHLQ